MIVKLLTENHLEFLSLKGGCRGSSESALVKKNVKLLEIPFRGSIMMAPCLMAISCVSRLIGENRVTGLLMVWNQRDIDFS